MHGHNNFVREEKYLEKKQEFVDGLLQSLIRPIFSSFESSWQIPDTKGRQIVLKTMIAEIRRCSLSLPSEFSALIILAIGVMEDIPLD